MGGLAAPAASARAALGFGYDIGHETPHMVTCFPSRVMTVSAGIPRIIQKMTSHAAFRSFKFRRSGLTLKAGDSFALYAASWVLHRRHGYGLLSGGSPRETGAVAQIQFVLGGARSGKSAHAEGLAEAAGSNRSTLQLPKSSIRKWNRGSNSTVSAGARTGSLWKRRSTCRKPLQKPTTGQRDPDRLPERVDHECAGA